MDHFELKDDVLSSERAGVLSNKLITTKEELFQEYKFDELTERNFYAYGVGHFLNDLTASCWFKYPASYAASPCTSW